jgi:hypothetical protein
VRRHYFVSAPRAVLTCAPCSRERAVRCSSSTQYVKKVLQRADFVAIRLDANWGNLVQCAKLAIARVADNG